MRCSIISASTVICAGLLGITSCGPTTTTCADYIGCNDAGGAAGRSGTGGAAGETSGGDSGMSGGGVAGSGGSPNGGRSGASGASGAAGDSGAGGEIVPPCDTTKSPSEEVCVVSDDYAIFVAPTGKDTAAGTKAAPVKTIAKAVELAGGTKIVIACDATYDEQVKLTAAAKLYGGFACPGSATPWTYEAGKRARVAPATRGIALSIAVGAAAVTVEDFEFDAKDGVDAGESSVAAAVKDSSEVALTRVKLAAGKGVDGANGTLTEISFPLQTDLNGRAGLLAAGGAAKMYACPVGGSTTGGKGGDGDTSVTGGGLGMPDLGMGKGGVQGSCSPNGTGQDGANAPAQAPAPGGTTLGTIVLAAWVGTSGTPGNPGAPGQGGGGGTGKGVSGGGGGGGGGAGGCGGAGGTGGKAGGSSIALLALNSTLALSASELLATDAGKGGKGAAGQVAKPPVGNGGLPDASGGCQGGQGGLGGSGGAGGGGAGGISVGIAYQGVKPVPDSATTVATGTAGAKGIGGVPNTNDGIAGVKQEILQVP